MTSLNGHLSTPQGQGWDGTLSSCVCLNRHLNLLSDLASSFTHFSEDQLNYKIIGFIKQICAQLLIPLL